MMYVVAIVLVLAASGFAATIGRVVIEFLGFLAMIGICIFICRGIANNQITSWGDVVFLSLLLGGALGLCYSPLSMVKDLEREVAELRRKIDNLQGLLRSGETARTTKIPDET